MSIKSMLGGLNIWGTAKVLFIDLFLNAYRFNLGYYLGYLLTNFRDAAKGKCKKKLDEEIWIF